MSGETQNYHETRNPITQTSDYSTITLSTTAKSIMSVTTDLPGSPLQVQQQGYWQIGKKWQVRMFGKATTAATPGNLTIEIRHQTGATVGDAGGTILATSGAVAMAASKTNASWFMDFTIESRAQIGTAQGLFAKGWFSTDPTTALVASTALPIFIPTTAAAAVNVDTTLASYINVQWKRSGSTAETVTVQDLQVNSIT
jgi:Spy/CpxP family protein refolding chaperone